MTKSISVVIDIDKHKCPRIFASSVAKNFLWALTVLSLPLAWPDQAAAQEAPKFSVSPRFFLTWLAGDESEPVSMPLGGLTASAVLAQQWDVAVTALYGVGDGTSEGFAGASEKKEFERLDFEAVLRYRIPESTGYLVGGFRNINVSDEQFENGVKRNEGLSRLYLVEIGAGFAARLSKSGRHAAFANLVIGAGPNYFKEDRFDGSPNVSRTQTSGLIDANLGYQYAIKRWLSASARYRIIAVGTWWKGQHGQNFVHGPEIAATFRF